MGTRFFSRLKGILVSGELTVDMLICLASSAQPADGAGLSRHKSRDKSVSEAWADQMDAVDAEEGDRELEPADEGGPEDTADPENAFGGGHCCAVFTCLLGNMFTRLTPTLPCLLGNVFTRRCEPD